MTTGRSPESVPARAPSVAAPSSTGGALAGALVALREATAATRFALDIPGAEGARESGAELVRQLDDYVLPRLRRLDAPLLTVVGGSTGAGKSTVVNSLVREQVTPSGVLRPTTRSPVLVCHPDDLRWFSDTRVLPELTRTSGAGTDHRTLQLVTSPSLDPGLAFLDAPDIDSVVTANRRLATQLLAAADLWLFVTTAARYADAVPWDVLQTAQERGTALACCSTGCRRAPRTTSRRTCGRCSPRTASAGRRCSSSPRRPCTTGLLPEPVGRPAPRLVLRPGTRRRPPGRGRPPDAGRGAGQPPPRTAGLAARPGRRSTPRPGCGPMPTPRTRARSPRSTRACATARCCAGRSWRAGRSSSAPASCCAPCRTGWAGCGTGSPRRSAAGPGRAPS